jgi:hypothetical protein
LLTATAAAMSAVGDAAMSDGAADNGSGSAEQQQQQQQQQQVMESSEDVNTASYTAVSDAPSGASQSSAVSAGSTSTAAGVPAAAVNDNHAASAAPAPAAPAVPVLTVPTAAAPVSIGQRAAAASGTARAGSARGRTPRLDAINSWSPLRDMTVWSPDSASTPGSEVSYCTYITTQHYMLLLVSVLVGQAREAQASCMHQSKMCQQQQELPLLFMPCQCIASTKYDRD